LAAGMADHIKKPIDLEELISTLLHHCPTAQTALTPDSSLAMCLPEGATSIDENAAIKRLGGNRALYARLLQSFSHSALAQVTVLQTCIAQQQWPEAIHCLHTLKGGAGTVGAMTLATLAETGERRCKQRLNTSTSSDHDRHADERLLHELREQIALLLANAAEPSSAPADSRLLSSTALDRVALSASLSELAMLLQQRNMRATRLCTQLNAQYGAILGAQLATLVQAVEQLDMDHALVACNALNQAISVAPTENR
jgi:HPt (histidine-containing phosphotransfer) domain-containing protein